MIAALFVANPGCYIGLPDVDPWDKARDARLYDGPWPVVAHPPCERWGRYWHGGPSAKVRRTLGDDDGCFASALASVRRWGGVLEHPEGSQAFARFDLPRPRWRAGWRSSNGWEWACCVAQGNYGHRARKLTWLFVSGIPRVFLPELNWTIPEPSSRLDYGFHSATERAERKAHVSPRVNASRLTTTENLATPLPFRDTLLLLARLAGKPRTAYRASDGLTEMRARETTMGWGVWLTEHGKNGRWLKGRDGAPKKFDDRINAIIQANEMRRMFRRYPTTGLHYKARELI